MSNPAKKQPTKPRLPAGLEPAGWGRRIGALVIDWVASSLVLIAIAGYDTYSNPRGSVLILPVFFAEIVLFTVLVGGSFGQVALKLRVRRVGGSRLSPWGTLIRSLLILLIIPPLIYKPDGRGLHDMAVDSAVYRLTT